MSEKLCPKCGEVKPLDKFYANKRAKSGKSSRCLDCSKKAARDWAIKNPDAILSTSFKHRYGITLPEYKALLASQDSACAICGSLQRGRYRLSVDHNHVTGKIRGLLCNPCNQAIGLFKEEKDTLESAIKYLEAHS